MKRRTNVAFSCEGATTCLSFLLVVSISRTYSKAVVPLAHVREWRQPRKKRESLFPPFNLQACLTGITTQLCLEVKGGNREIAFLYSSHYSFLHTQSVMTMSLKEGVWEEYRKQSLFMVVLLYRDTMKYVSR